MSPKALRRRAGLTQMQLAVALALSLGTVQTIESGKHIPRADTAIKYARALGVTVEAVAWGTRPSKEEEE